MFDRVQVRALAGPLKDIQRLVPKPLLRWLGCVLRVVDAATTMLHHRDGARCPPEVTRDIQAKVFNLGFIIPENLVSHGLRVL